MDGLKVFLLLSSLVVGHVAYGSLVPDCQGISESGMGSGSGIGLQLMPGPILPYGEGAGDTVLLLPGRISVGPLSLSPSFRYFGQNMDNFFISSRGYISFRTNCSECSSPRAFPFISPPLIAVLWQEFNTDNISMAFRLATDEETIMNTYNYVFCERSDLFTPSYIVVVTWFMGPSEDPQPNIFQTLLASDGSSSYVVFAYGNLQQSLLGAQVGFNMGDGMNFLTVAEVSTGDSIDIEMRSNVRSSDITGRYLYKVDDLSRMPSCFDGILEPAQFTRETLGLSEDGRPRFKVTALVELCLDGVCGGICDRGFGAYEAEYMCLAFTSIFGNASLTGSEPLFNSYLNYTGHIVLQDVNCTDYRANGCAKSTEIDPFCTNSSRAVGVGCYFTGTIMCLVGGELRAEVIEEGLSTNTGIAYPTSLLLEVCANGFFGGICRKGFDDVDASIACRSLYLGDRGEVAVDQSNNYKGLLVVQDVECQGNETRLFQCQVSTNIDSYCTISSSIVRINCFRIDLLPFGEDAGDQFLGSGDDTILQLSLTNTSFIFYGMAYNDVFISTDGVISLGTSFAGSGVQDFPIQSPPLIAPFWLNVDTTNGGFVSYRFINDQNSAYIDNTVGSLIDRNFTSTSILLVTWHEIPLVSSNITSGSNQALLVSNGVESYVFFIYSNGSGRPNGAEVGLNDGDGFNFLSEASVVDGGSDRIAIGSNLPKPGLRGLYYYRVDNLKRSVTPAPTDTPSPPDVCFIETQLRLTQIGSISRISLSGITQIGVAALLQVCAAGSFGGICRAGFDDDDVTVACKSLDYVEGEVAADQSNNYTGQIVLQDVECQGNETQLSQCQVSVDIDSYCRNSSSIVRINCYLQPDECQAANNGQGAPCRNGGMCVSVLDDYMCQCVGSYGGRNCELPTFPAVITSSPASGDYSVGSQASLTCGISGFPAPIVSWFFNGVLRTNFAPVSTVTFAVTPENRGEYFCRANNSLGAPASSAVAFISLNDVQQYLVELAVANITRRKRQTMQDTIEQLVNQTVGFDVGRMGVTIYSATVLSVNNMSAQTLYTLRRPRDVEMPLASALRLTIMSPLTGLTVGTITRFDGCSEEPMGPYIWPETSINPSLPAELSCACNNLNYEERLAFRATRVCGGDFSNGGVWQTPDATSCTFDEYTQRICSATSGEVLDVIAQDLINSTPKSLDITFNVLDNALGMAAATVQDVNQVASILDDIISMFDPTLDEESKKVNISITSKLFDGIEKVGDALQTVTSGEATTIKQARFEIRVENVDLSDLASSKFMVNTGSPSVEFPQEILSLLPGGSANVPLVLATIDPEVFQAGLSSGIDSGTLGTLFSVSIANIVVVGLEVAVKLTFPRLSDNVVASSCVFWDTALNSGLGDWSNSGCILESSSGPSICKCNHLSIYGVIYVPVVATTMITAEPTEPSRIFEVSPIIYIGLSISFVALFITILTYIISRKLRKQAQIIIINISLISLYIAFILSSLAKQLDNYDTTYQRICGLFSAILQYFMLLYFLWTASEAIILFYMTRNMFRIPKYHFVISALVCLVCPLVIVAISLGGYQYFLRGTFCRPTNWPFYFGFVLPFVLTMLFNWALYGAALFFLQASNNKLNVGLKIYLRRYIYAAAILSVLFTVAWIFGLIGTSNIARDAHVASQYIFSIFATFHSVLTLLFHTLRSNTARENWRRLWYIITCSHGQYNPKNTYVIATPQDKMVKDTELAEGTEETLQQRASDDETLLSSKSHDSNFEDKVVENTFTNYPDSSEKIVDEEVVKVDLELGNEDTPL